MVLFSCVHVVVALDAEVNQVEEVVQLRVFRILAGEVDVMHFKFWRTILIDSAYLAEWVAMFFKERLAIL